MFIAKMHTRYPDYHGKGYYNFIIESDEDVLNSKIEEMSHDFSLDGTVKTRFKSVEAITTKYPSKDKLNERFFNA